VGLRDALFGKKKLSEPKDDRLFALTTSAVTLEVELGLKTAGVAALAFKPQSSGEFRNAFEEIDKLIAAVAESCGSQVDRKTDEYGYEWIVIRDPDLEDLVTTVHTLASELTAQGFGSQLSLRRSSSRAAESRSTGSTASSAAPSGRSSRAASTRATTRRSWS